MKFGVKFLLGGVLAISLCTLLIMSPAFADDSSIDKAKFTIPISCTLSASSNSHSETMMGGTYNNNVGNNPTSITTYCNDANGYILYAIGYSNNTEGNTDLISKNGIIPTGTATSGDISAWGVKITSLDNTLTMNSAYSPNFGNIPSSWDWVAKKEAGTVDSTIGSSITATYGAYVSPSQVAGAYTGKVKYVLLHPSSYETPVTFSKAMADNGKQKYLGYYKMQDMSPEICNAVNVFDESSELELIDVRDGSVYWVAKLRDGNCWMTENLDLNLETTSTNVASLTSENTNLKLYGSKGYDSANGYTCSNPDTTTNCAADGEVITWTPERATIAPTELNSTNWKNDYINPYSYDRGIVSPDGYKDGHGLAGNYYNLTAAIASNDSSYYTEGNAANSICPKGWRLSNTETYEFGKLLYIYNIINDYIYGTEYTDDGPYRIISSPLYFTKSGGVHDGFIANSAMNGNYYSGTIASVSSAFALGFNSVPNTIGASYRNNRYDGLSIRCLVE